MESALPLPDAAIAMERERIGRARQAQPRWTTDPSDPLPPPQPFPVRPFRWRDPSTIPPRDWLYGKIYLRGIVTATVAPGGVGKSSLLMAEALAMATGKPLLGISPALGEPLRVLYWNGEDAEVELERRFAALKLYFQISEDDVGGRLSAHSGFDIPFKIASTTKDGPRIDERVSESLRLTIERNGFDIVMFDPFISAHAVPENDNSAVDLAVKELARIGYLTGAAIGLSHHTRKSLSDELTVDDGRGAKALIDAARVGRVLNVMGEKEAEAAQVEKTERFSFFRINDAHGKANLSRRVDREEWFRLVSQDLGNGDATHPADEIGVVTTWRAPGLLDGMTSSDLLKVQREIDDAMKAGKPWRYSPQADHWAGEAVAAVLGLDLTNEADKRRVKGMLAVWEKSGALKKAQHRCEDHKDRPCVIVGEWAT